jgi:hypothetical protein
MSFRIYKAVPLELYNKFMNEVLDSAAIISILKPEQRANAESIFKLLTNLKWNSTGEIIYKDKTIPNTRILELISFVTSEHENPPLGLEIFVSALKEINIPQALLSAQAKRYFNKSSNWIKFKDGRAKR